MDIGTFKRFLAMCGIKPGGSGKAIQSAVTTYQNSASGTVTPTGTWTNSPAPTNGQYLWARTITTYTDNTTSTAYNVAYVGTNGTNGNPGVGIASEAITYQAGSSGTAAPTGTWTAAVPAVTPGQFLWSRIVTTYTDASTSTVYAVAYAGTNGNNGVGVSSNAVTYQASTSGTVVPTGTWTSSIPSVPSGQFLWTRLVITFSDSTTATTYGVSYNPAVSNLTMIQSAVGWSVTNTPAAGTVQTAVAIPVPIGAMLQNSRMEIEVEYTINGTTATKTLDITDSATGFIIATNGGTFSGSGYYGQHVAVTNRGALNSQFIRNKAITVPFGTGSANGTAQNPGTLDFSATRTINLNVTFSTTGGTETVKVEAYQIRIWTP